MKRLLLLLVAFLPLAAFGAAGDLQNAQIESQGCVMSFTYVGATNGTFAFGFLTNNSGPSKVIVNLTSLGYDDTGNVITVPRQLYGTKQLRLPYPQDAVNDVKTNAGAGTVVIRIWLSDYVFNSDSNITVSVSSSWYASNTATNSMIVTNNSSITHPLCVGNWSWPGFQRVTNSVMQLRAVAFHRSGQQGRPVRAMQFYATDFNTTQTVWQTRMQIDSTMPDAVPVQEYIGNIDCSGFTNGVYLRCGFKAYPWVGDTNSILDTANGTNVDHHLYSYQTNWLDRLNNQGFVYATVANNGNDSTGYASNAFNPNMKPFLTIAGAITAGVGTNAIQNSRGSGRGVNIYLTNGFYTWFGDNISSLGTNDNSWLNISLMPGVAAGKVWVTNVSNFGEAPQLNLHINGLYFTNYDNFIFGHYPNLWLNRCMFGNKEATVLFNGVVSYSFTHCMVSNVINSFQPCLYRGNTYVAPEPAMSIAPFCTIGNVFGGAGLVNRCLMQWHFAGQTEPVADPFIVAYNKLYNFFVSGFSVFYGDTAISKGAAVVNNVFEVSTNDSGAQSAGYMAGGVDLASTNAIFAQNTMLGGKCNSFYNEIGSTPAWMRVNRYYGNLVDDINMKSDTSVSSGANGGRIGNWSTENGVGFSWNQFPEIAGVGAPGSFMPEFSGLNTVFSDGVWTSDKSYFGYVAPAAFDGSNPGAGGGNYRLKSSGYVMRFPIDPFTPFDIEGVPRGRFDPPGAYASASPTKGAAFFAQ